MVATQPATTALWSTFTGKAELLGAVVMRAPSGAAAASLIVDTLPTFVCTASAGRRSARLSSADCWRGTEPAAEVVAGAAYAIAETGSVALNEPAADRARCFLAERLWLLVPEREIVPTLDLGLARMRALVLDGAHHPLLMSGPSRTADIERILTIGVHGPRALTIVVVGDA